MDSAADDFTHLRLQAADDLVNVRSHAFDSTLEGIFRILSLKREVSIFTAHAGVDSVDHLTLGVVRFGLDRALVLNAKRFRERVRPLFDRLHCLLHHASISINIHSRRTSRNKTRAAVIAHLRHTALERRNNRHSLSPLSEGQHAVANTPTRTRRLCIRIRTDAGCLRGTRIRVKQAHRVIDHVAVGDL